KPLIMVEAAILYETKMDRLVDYVIVVYATKSQRFKRIKKRDNLTTLEIKSRMAAQIPLEQKKKKTEFIINNTGGLKQTEQQVKLNYRGFNTLLYLQELVKLLEHMQ
ncbi:MAG: dephospho-CoA kinase, partial [bacterium]